jgi:excisionase family DNA binding protein
MQKFLNSKQAAKYLCVSLSTIYSLSHKQLIKKFKPNGGKIYFLLDDLDKYILNGSKETQSEKDLHEIGGYHE